MPTGPHGDTGDNRNNIWTPIDSVYQSVWTDFYAFEEACSREDIAGLACGINKTDLELDYGITLDEGEDAFTSSATLEPAQDTYEVFTVYTFSESAQPSSSTCTPQLVLVPHAEDYFLPSPPYESTSAAATNINHGDDPDHLPFIPFADDQDFDYRCYAREYREIEWQSYKDE